MANMLKALSGVSKQNDDYVKSVGSGVAFRSKQARDVEDALNPKPSKPAAKASSDSDRPMNPNAKYGDKAGEKRIDTDEMTKPLGSFKKGGKVPKTGPYKLHKGERVLNRKQTKKLERRGMRAVLGGR